MKGQSKTRLEYVGGMFGLCPNELAICRYGCKTKMKQFNTSAFAPCPFGLGRVKVTESYMTTLAHVKKPTHVISRLSRDYSLGKQNIYHATQSLVFHTITLNHKMISWFCKDIENTSYVIYVIYSDICT